LNDQLLSLVSLLEQESAELATADYEKVAAIVNRRREILSRINNAIAEGGVPGQRQQLAARIKAIFDRDSRLIVALQLQCDEIKKQLDNMVQARSAARGYRPGEGERPSKLDRRA
jgi:hypothetical protein